MDNYYNKYERYLINSFLETTDFNFNIEKDNSTLDDFTNHIIPSLITDERISYVYDSIKGYFDFQSAQDAKKVIDVILYYYLLNKPNAKVLKKEEYENYFLKNEIFGKKVLLNFFRNSLDKEINEEKENDLKDNNIERFNGISNYIIKVYGLNDYLRSTFFDLFCEYEEESHRKLAIVIASYLNGQINVKDPDLKNKLDIIKNYKPYFVKLIYMDMLEISLSRKELKKVGVLTKEIINNPFVDFNDKLLLDENIVLIYFNIILNSNDRMEARFNLNADDYKLIRKHNPLCVLDEY